MVLIKGKTLPISRNNYHDRKRNKSTTRTYRIPVPPPLGLHDPHQVRVEQRDPVPPPVHRQQPLPQGLQGRGAPRRAPQHLRQDHPVHRAGEARLRHARDRLRPALRREADQGMCNISSEQFYRNGVFGY